MKKKFLDLGLQPIANGFIEHSQPEQYFNLSVGFNNQTKLVSLMNFISPKIMFNDSYVYHTSQSKTMKEHFLEASFALNELFSPRSVMEIGSNDGAFIKNFPQETTIAVEPCKNFADITSEAGYYTYSNFWTKELSQKIEKEKGKQDLIFSANCMCHIPNILDAFYSVKYILSENGVFVFEDPSLLDMIKRGSYDQIYDEHAHIFSVMALKNLLNQVGLELIRVEHLDVHGGSNRIYACHSGVREIDPSVEQHINIEAHEMLDKFETYLKFANRVEKSKNELIKMLRKYKRNGQKIVSYGATSKSTTVFNYCGIDKNLIEYIVDTTPSKQGKLSPGVNIPVLSPEQGFDDTVDVAFLGAWNFEKEILKKEENFLSRGGVFISHVPEVRIIKS